MHYTAAFIHTQNGRRRYHNISPLNQWTNIAPKDELENFLFQAVENLLYFIDLAGQDWALSKKKARFKTGCYIENSFSYESCSSFHLLLPHPGITCFSL